MYKKEEERLTDYKQTYDHVNIPLDLVDDAILKGFQMAKSEEKRKPKMKKWIVSLAAAALILLGFFTSIRLSPAFAEYVTVIPGMEKLVEIIRNDRGKMLAIENDYYEKIDVSDKKHGLKFTIDGTIADENGMVLFYTVESNQKQKQLMIEEARLESLDGEELNIGSASHGSPLYSEEGQTSYKDYLEYYFQTPLKTRKFNLKVKVKGEKQTEEYTLAFQLKKDIKKVKTYKLNKTVSLKGQKLKFENVDIYPLRAAVHVRMDKNNTKMLLNFDDLRLVDERGETWNKIVSGITASRISDDEAIIYLQSNYFRKPKELYLVLTKVQAVDKDSEHVIVDIEKEQILKQPNGELLTNLKVVGDTINLTLHTTEAFHYDPFGRIINGDGEELNPQTSFSYHDKMVELGVQIPNLKSQPAPISLELTAFPTWINGDCRVRIK